MGVGLRAYALNFNSYCVPGIACCVPGIACPPNSQGHAAQLGARAAAADRPGASAAGDDRQATRAGAGIVVVRLERIESYRTWHPNPLQLLQPRHCINRVFSVNSRNELRLDSIAKSEKSREITAPFCIKQPIYS